MMPGISLMLPVNFTLQSFKLNWFGITDSSHLCSLQLMLCVSGNACFLKKEAETAQSVL